MAVAEIVITILFFMLAAINAVLLALFFLPEKTRNAKFFPPLSVIIPAHNEEKYIEDTLASVASSDYPNKLEIIVVDDGSGDKTADTARKNKNVRVFTIKHSGKSAAINYGLKKARYGFIAYLDADSRLQKDSLLKLMQPLGDKNVSISSGIIRAKTTKNPLSWFQDIDYIASSGWRYACSKKGGTYVAPGFAAFRKKDMLKAGGFSSDTLTEDIDTTLCMRKKGYGAAMSSAVMFTSVPSTLHSFVRQRMRWGRGTIQTARKHRDIILNRKAKMLGLYSFPMHLFWYPFSLLYLPFALYWMFSVYFSSGAVLPLDTFVFFVKWLTIYGIADLIYNVVNGTYAVTPTILSILLSWSLSFSYLLLSMKKFSAFSWKTFSCVLMFPYYWLVFAVQAAALVVELFSKSSGNRWNKSNT